MTAYSFVVCIFRGRVRNPMGIAVWADAIMRRRVNDVKRVANEPGSCPRREKHVVTVAQCGSDL